MAKEIIAIWAQDEKGLIGKDNHLPWHLPKELQHFKQTTMGQALVMGRVTFDGMGRRLLPGRETLILSRQTDLDLAEAKTFSSPEAVLSWFEQQEKDLYVVGGASVYQTFAPYYDRLIVTTVAGDFQGDTFFPAFDFSDYRPISEEQVAADDQNAHPFTITTYIKKEEETHAT